MRKTNAANTKKHTNPQNNCKTEMPQIHSTKWKCARPLGGLDQSICEFLALHHPRVCSILPFAVRLPLSATVNIHTNQTVSSVERALSPLSL